MSPDDTARTPDDDLDRLMRGALPGEFSFFGRQKEQQPPPLTGIEPGRVIDDFKLIAPIGQGGMGQVWEAEQVSLNRRVALKLVRPDRVNEHTLDLFSREARAGGRLSHPGIVTVYGHGEAEGVAWISMELVEGAWTLKDFIEETARTGELPENYYKAVAELVAEVADALEAAHEANVIHRDLKPANVLITPDEHPKVTDFGLAKITDETALSVTGDFAGTYAYMSPEQVAARRAGLDHRTDVFSLGIVLYEMLTLRRPFEGDTSQQVAHQILVEEAPNPRKLRSRIPLDLAIISGKCLEKNRERRYQSMGDLAADIRRQLANEPILAKPPTTWQRGVKWLARHPTVSSIGAVGAAALVIISFLLAANIRASETISAKMESVKRLSALQDYDELMAEADNLWPPHPENVDAYVKWIGQTQALVDDLSLHYAKRDELRGESLSQAGEERDEEGQKWDFPDTEEGRESRWWHVSLMKLIESLEGLLDPETGLLSDAEGAVSVEHGWSVPRRLRFAERLRDDLVESGEVHERWQEAIAAIVTHPRYGGLRLSRVMGLVPIGSDPNSELWEFWHVATGEEPERGKDGRLVPTPETGLVLVLIPGDKFLMGAQSEDPEGPNYDPLAQGKEGPVHEVELSPYFLAKYEMSQGQWKRFVGNSPSAYGPHNWKDWSEDSHDASDVHPVEQVNWNQCVLQLSRMGLALPSEAQWENGARAGTTSPWWTGDEKETLPGAANLSDAFLERAGLKRFIEEWLDDGYAYHAPVDALRPNGFGLHHVLGNVGEWCLDGYDEEGFYARSPTTDPVSPNANADHRVLRGGCWTQISDFARSAYRGVEDPWLAYQDSGVRPARAITK